PPRVTSTASDALANAAKGRSDVLLAHACGESVLWTQDGAASIDIEWDRAGRPLHSRSRGGLRGVVPREPRRPHPGSPGIAAGRELFGRIRLLVRAPGGGKRVRILGGRSRVVRARVD